MVIVIFPTYIKLSISELQYHNAHIIQFFLKTIMIQYMENLHSFAEINWIAIKDSIFASADWLKGNGLLWGKHLNQLSEML